mmetsp:Transcript_62665/g.149488  ORF Transcript_62665/g.149488 Transcript_62665/m.149488 type:complete len:165 (-) Transcript_62665:19-513(-)
MGFHRCAAAFVLAPCILVRGLQLSGGDAQPLPPASFQAPQVPTVQVPASAVAAMRDEISELRQEVAQSNKEMWEALKMVSTTVDRDGEALRSMTRDIATLRGRRGGAEPPALDECSQRQASCGNCLDSPACIWCEVEQRCFKGDAQGPLKGQCLMYRHGQCDAN